MKLEGTHEAWVVAVADGRFISLPILSKEVAERNHDPYTEHLVRITFDDPKGAPTCSK